MNKADAAFAAGIVLKSLGDLIRVDPPWIGYWVDKLALKSAAIVAKMLGRDEEEAALGIVDPPRVMIPGRPGRCFGHTITP